MRNLIPLDTDPIDDYDAITNSKHNPAKFVLEQSRPFVFDRYNQYKNLFDKNRLEDLNKSVITPDQIIYLKDCYSNSTQALNNIIANIKNKQPSHLRSICQYCGIDTDNTVDHYLPQSDFPEFSVNHLNLFPCCAVCNPIKNNYWFDGVNFHRGIINLYIDEYPIEQFLFVDVKLIDSNPIIKYEINNSNRINPRLYQIIENHFKRIKLIDKYNDKSSNIFTRIYNMYFGKAVYSGNSQLIKQDLLIDAQNHFSSFGRNHYEGVLIEALANNNDFINLF
ncbi:HNH endonuclease [Flavobacterium mekongense]|uniref:HNH endonuclease n=1 Tax=Flavobacterium mekongense TaxID=3379707 RepID=UPI00399AD0AB